MSIKFRGNVLQKKVIAHRDFSERIRTDLDTSAIENHIHSYRTSDSRDNPDFASDLDTWYEWEPWALFGETDLGCDMTEIKGLLRSFTIVDGTWNVRLRDATNSKTLMDWTGLTSSDDTVSVSASNTYPADWPAASETNILVEYQQTAGLTGQYWLGIDYIHILTRGTVSA